MSDFIAVLLAPAASRVIKAIAGHRYRIMRYSGHGAGRVRRYRGSPMAQAVATDQGAYRQEARCVCGDGSWRRQEVKRPARRAAAAAISAKANTNTIMKPARIIPPPATRRSLRGLRRADPQSPVRQRQQAAERHQHRAEPDQQHQRLVIDAHRDGAVGGRFAQRDIELAGAARQQRGFGGRRCRAR